MSNLLEKEYADQKMFWSTETTLMVFQSEKATKFLRKVLEDGELMRLKSDTDPSTTLTGIKTSMSVN